MPWHQKIIDQFAATATGGYHVDGPMSTEPTALAALALCNAGRIDAAAPAWDWLAKRQNADGSFGPTEQLDSPCWPTSLVVQAAVFASGNDSTDCFFFTPNPSSQAQRRRLVLNSQSSLAPAVRTEVNVAKAIDWLLNARGGTMERTEKDGHDSTLVGWPWVIGTHSWIEPTALAVMALRGAGHGDHARTREAVQLLQDRLLPNGGCNYGNTVVLGQELLPHLQPTAIALIALYGEPDNDERIGKSLQYLRDGLGSATATASLCYGLIALAKYGQLPRYADQCLQRAYQRTLTRGPSTYKLALLALAAGHLAAKEQGS